VTPLGWLAAIVVFVQLPIPLFWFVMHPQINHWRDHRGAGYVTVLRLAWVWRAIVGFAFLFLEVWIFWRVKRDLGGSRLIGQTEVSGGGEVARQGIYARIRHPRYVSWLLANLGACFLAGTQLLWTVAGIGTALTLVAISMEERDCGPNSGARLASRA
jgi:protein-S-isoprenylcysteine O-methyltransferase Ste14